MPLRTQFFLFCVPDIRFWNISFNGKLSIHYKNKKNPCKIVLYIFLFSRMNPSIPQVIKFHLSMKKLYVCDVTLKKKERKKALVLSWQSGWSYPQYIKTFSKLSVFTVGNLFVNYTLVTHIGFFLTEGWGSTYIHTMWWVSHHDQTQSLTFKFLVWVPLNVAERPAALPDKTCFEKSSSFPD